MLCSHYSIEGDVSKIIEINKRRWQIEECFRIMKRTLKLDLFIYKGMTGSKHISLLVSCHYRFISYWKTN
ncbi:MAG: transposase [Erysipelotrichaceae bacterium]|nr:transposase [Erysipelotrichaceae bacterium]